MNTMAIISIIFGIIILGSRIPFILSTEGAVSYYENLVENDFKLSIFGIFLVLTNNYLICIQTTKQK